MAKELKFRNLKAHEVDVRVSRIVGKGDNKGVALLLYKDARCDMAILDETVGALNWQRTHFRDNRNCQVRILNEETSEWVGKEDTGTESNTESEKGLASDSFKRACVNWGIGRELYTAPDVIIWEGNYINDAGKCFERFRVAKMEVAEGEIIELVIVDSKGKECFTWSMSGARAERLKGRAKLERVKAGAVKVLVEGGYDMGNIIKAFDEHGYVPDLGASISELVGMVNSEEKLINIGKRVKEISATPGE